MRICSLASGSRGNCIYIETPKTNLLIDAGISVKSIYAKCIQCDIDILKINAILVTHEHSDHISGLGALSRDLNIPVYCHPKTRAAINDSQKDFNYAGDNDNYELGFDIEGVTVKPFRTPHDAEYSCGYRIEFDGASIAVATDLGLVNNGVFNNLVNADIVMLESNHNVDMLKSCGYPRFLVNRILGNNGHLSNELCAAAVRKLYERGTRKFILGHLSEKSNLSELAYQATNSELREVDCGEFVLKVAEQNVPSGFVE